MDNNLNSKVLNKRVAALESQVDLLESELTYLNGLLFDVGFPEGIETLKVTAEELLADGPSIHQRHHKGI